MSSITEWPIVGQLAFLAAFWFGLTVVVPALLRGILNMPWRAWQPIRVALNKPRQVWRPLVLAGRAYAWLIIGLLILAMTLTTLALISAFIDLALE